MSSREAIAEAIEEFIRMEFLIGNVDPLFTRNAHLFELGFVDSVGFAELLTFVEGRYGIELDPEHLFTDNVSSIDGLSEIVHSLLTR